MPDAAEPTLAEKLDALWREFIGMHGRQPALPVPQPTAALAPDEAQELLSRNYPLQTPDETG